MKNFVKVFSVVLSLIMIISMIPCAAFGAFADDVKNSDLSKALWQALFTSNELTATADTATDDTSTPDESTPDESTPDESTPDESTPDESTPDSKVLGDVDGDGELNIKDGTLIQLYLAKLITEDKLDLSVADYNKDKEVNILDVTYIQFKLANLSVV